LLLAGGIIDNLRNSLHQWLQASVALHAVTYLFRNTLRDGFYETREVAMEVRVLLELDLSLLPFFVN
jgi:hypothetical protein